MTPDLLREWFGKRHQFCTRFEDAVRSLIRGGNIFLERDETGRLTGRYYYSNNPPKDVVAGGKGVWRILQVVCEHPEDGICGGPESTYKATEPGATYPAIATLEDLYKKFGGKKSIRETSTRESTTAGVEPKKQPSRRAIAASALAARANELSDEGEKPLETPIAPAEVPAAEATPQPESRSRRRTTPVTPSPVSRQSKDRKDSKPDNVPGGTGESTGGSGGGNDDFLEALRLLQEETGDI